MRYFAILCAMIYILNLTLAANIYGEDSANITKDSTNGSAVTEKYPDTATQRGEKNTVEDKADNTNFSDYPKSFIIPRGVCETNEPSMIINR
ncbi:MAG: hypothetical protein HZB80_01470 [Deltaproteobacteria bacterium]|nr:hypothetical protein [Deltaproteobacteria bacterium]